MASNLHSDDEVISGINVTPLVDVVLVLLIIFLITAPVIYQNAIKVQLPSAKSGEQSKPSNLQFIIRQNGDIFWKDQKVTISDLPKLLQAEQFTKNESAYISADKSTPHGNVIQLMDLLRERGIFKLSLTVESK